MKNFIFIKFIASLCLVLLTSLTCWAQTSLKDFTVIYDKSYKIDDAYSIRYNNLEEPSKLNAFKIEFYAPDNSKLGETTEAYPINGTSKIYYLSNADIKFHPIAKFNSIKVSIISLHEEGSISNFPSSANAILELTENNVIPPTSSNTPPSIQNYTSEIDASTDTVNLNISSYYSDPDGDVVTVIPKSLNGDEFSYSLEGNGNLTITAPSVTGTYSFPYEIRDSKGAKAAAEVTINVNIPETLKTKIEDQARDIAQIISDLADREAQIGVLGSVPDETLQRLDALLVKNEALEKKATDPKLSTLKNDIAQLTEELKISKNTASAKDLLGSIEGLETESVALQTALQTLQSQSLEEGLDVNSFKAELTRFEKTLGTLNNTADTITVPTLLTAAQMDGWEAHHFALKQQIPPSFLKWGLGVLAILALGSLIFWGLKTQLKPSPNGNNNREKSDEKDNDEKVNKETVIASFPVYVVNTTERGFGKTLKNYPQDMNNYNEKTGKLDIPRPKGLIIADNPSFLIYKDPLQAKDFIKKAESSGDPKDQSSDIPAWREAYRATGRIGLAQDGIPEGADSSYGTCVLIGPNHIMTNRHVFDTYADLIQDSKQNTGVEFFGEVDSDASEFYKILPVEPIILEERDAVILTLAETVDIEHRTPVQFSTNPPQSYAEDEVVVIGYPQEPENFDELDERQMQVYREIYIFGVKRYSVGPIFSHSIDLDGDYIAHTDTSGEYSQDCVQPAVTHLASTLPGNSGSPIVSKSTGHVIGLHFGDGLFEAEPANVGHSGQILADFVMTVTSGNFTTS